MVEHFKDGFSVVVHNVSAQSDDWLHDELDEASSQSGTIVSGLLLFPFLSFLIKVVITPKFLHHLIVVYLEFFWVDTSEFGQCEGPSEQGWTKSYSTLARVDLLGLAHIFALIGGDDNISIFDDTLEVLIHGLTIYLQF